jgi:trigger factor
LFAILKKLRTQEYCCKRDSGTRIVAGFQKRQVPDDVIRRTFPKELNEETKKHLNEMLSDKLKKEHKITPTYVINFEELKFNPSEAYEFVTIIETEPEFELPNYKGLLIKRPVMEITEKDVEDAINKLRQKEAKYVDVERPAAPGDIVVVNYSGSCDGKSIDEIVPDAKRLAKGENNWIRVEKDSFLPGFGEQFVGTKKGDKLQIPVEFPANFILKELANKKAIFDVEVLDVKEEVLPELNDAYAKTLGAKSLEELKEGVKFDLKNDLNHKIRQNLRDQVVEELMSRVNFELPENELNDETKESVLNIVMEQQRRGMSKEEIEKHKDEIFNIALGRAKNLVKARYVFAKIADKEGIKVSQEELMNEISLAARMNNEDPKKYIERITKNNRLGRFYEIIIAQKVVDFLVEYAKIEDVLPDQTSVAK